MFPEDIEIVEQTPALVCGRRGAAIDLLLDRPRLARSRRKAGSRLRLCGRGWMRRSVAQG
jgi:hypothetical protein